MDFNMHQELLPDISTSTSSPIIDSATSAELDESQCKLSGYLNIQVEHKKRFGQRWKRRYVIVSEGCLNVYLNENAKNLKKSYPICAFERVTPYENDYTFKLTFREANRPPIVCSCKSSLNRTEWVRQIDTAISFGGDSGFESGEMLQHKTPDIHTTGLHPAYSTVDESKLYKARQDATGTSEDFSYDGRRYKTKHYAAGTTEEPLSESEDNRSIGSEDNESFYDECKPNLFERYQTGSHSFLRTKSSLKRQTTFKEYNEDHEPLYQNVLPAKSQYMSERTLLWKELSSTIPIGKPFMPEPYQTGMVANVQVESLQTDKKGSWEKCFECSRNFENDAKRLIVQGCLPNHRFLKKICKNYGRKSEIIQIISNGICQSIKEQSNNIVHVWPAYRLKRGMDCSEDLIVFVVITNKQTNIQSDYEICQRQLNQISSSSENENKRIHDNEKLNDLRSDDLALYVKSKAKELMEKHKKLTWVTVSGIKSSGYDMDHHRMVKLPCIALNVQIKGLIPIDEDPFEQFLDGYPVDVREGVFSLCGLPTDLHQNVRMGCALDSGCGTQQGTIGPFFKYETDLHTYLLTSAHVLLGPEQMQKLIVDNEVHYRTFDTDTYQPPESKSMEFNSSHHLGKLEFAVYRTGKQNKPGMEIALVRIDDQRVPIDGHFPTHENNHDSISLDDISSYLKHDQVVYKYGSQTGLTEGKVRFNGGSVRTDVLNVQYLGTDITLHEQIEIDSPVGFPFGVAGDSGALVFRKDEKKLIVIGIFEGIIGNTYMVTPIRGIIDVLSEVMSLYKDPPNDSLMDFEEHTSNITIMLKHALSNSGPLSAIIERHISAEISRKTNEIQTNILHHTEQKFVSVSAELKTIEKNIETHIEKHIDTKIDHLKREIIEGVRGQISALIPTVNNNMQ